jgi:AraC-like DNA-binding protein
VNPKSSATALSFVRDPASVRLMVEFGEQRGVGAAALLRGTGLQRAQLQDPQVELQAAQELAVVANLIRALRNPRWLGLELGLQYGFTTYGIWGYGLVASATVGEALGLALRFLPLTYAFAQVSTALVGADFHMQFGAPAVDEPVRSFLAQRDLAAAARLVADLAGPTVRLKALRLSDTPPGDADIRRSLPLLGDCPCEFGAPVNALVIDAQALNHKLPNANPLTAAMCEQLCATLVERRRRRHGTAELVRAQLMSSAGQHGAMPDLAQMAGLLYTSERTLKRRLQGEGSSFRALQAAAREQLACELLADERLPLAEIAARLGFSDQSSFSQTFKRWRGVAPGQWRRALADGSAEP